MPLQLKLKFSDNAGGPGWIVGSELGGLTLNIVTRGNRKNKNPEIDDDDEHGCPVGIKGAYDRVSQHFSSLKIFSWDLLTLLE
jgi:hypothetical protein